MRAESFGQERSPKAVPRRDRTVVADGMSTREIGRTMDCTTGAASKCRVRYAGDRLAGLAEVGERGAAPKYGPAHQRRILVILDQPPSPGYSDRTASLMARALVDVHEQYIWRFLRAQQIDLLAASPGARALTRTSSPRRPRSSPCIWRRRRTWSSCRSMRSHPSGTVRFSV